MPMEEEVGALIPVKEVPEPPWDPPPTLKDPRSSMEPNTPDDHSNPDGPEKEKEEKENGPEDPGPCPEKWKNTEKGKNKELEKDPPDLNEARDKSQGAGGKVKKLTEFFNKLDSDNKECSEDNTNDKLPTPRKPKNDTTKATKNTPNSIAKNKKKGRKPKLEEPERKKMEAALRNFLVSKKGDIKQDPTNSNKL